VTGDPHAAMNSPKTLVNAPASGSDLPLHDDAGLVSEAEFEQQLELVATNARLPSAGIFGPGSMTWRIDREAIIFLAAGRALLLQLAHPWITAAIAEHSRVTAQPIVRFHRTFNVVFALVFGTLDQAFAAARSLHRRHARITGFLPETTGPFKSGSRYCANNISALRWVYATLIDSALVAHDLVFEPLSAEDRARHYSESRLFAGMLGIPRSALPADYGGLAAYAESMCRSDVLTVSAAARSVAQQIFAGDGSWTRVPASYKALTAGLMPERLRQDFGLAYGQPERRGADRMLAWIRRAYFIAPDRLRYVAPYQEARQRLAGRTRPDTVTRLLNRLWIGQPSLAGKAPP
jgi:uncharacterized protein (DUF2236 family)